MSDKTTNLRNRQARGKPYSLEEFQRRYRLDDNAAAELYRRFGPSSVELDILMSAKSSRPSINVITEDMGL